jgi:hypothetical protein
LRLTVLSLPKKDTGNAAPVKPPPQPSKPTADAAEPPPDEAGDPGPWFAGLNEAAE